MRFRNPWESATLGTSRAIRDGMTAHDAAMTSRRKAEKGVGPAVND